MKFSYRAYPIKDGRNSYIAEGRDVWKFLLFLKFCPIEIKNLQSGKRLKEISCKYANDTKSNIQMIDSTWFTTLVKSYAFKVSGHFRLQASGENHSQRKLVWISDFQKKGYTRKAKKLTNI
jgi:hypothetical protein